MGSILLSCSRTYLNDSSRKAGHGVRGSPLPLSLPYSLAWASPSSEACVTVDHTHQAASLYLYDIYVNLKKRTLTFCSMATSFKKKGGASRPQHPRGSRPSLHNSQLLVSSGVPSMDVLLGTASVTMTLTYSIYDVLIQVEV